MREKTGEERVIKSAGVVSAGTLLSRITGLIRLQVIAYLFGYSQATDAFWLAFSLPNLMRALLAEGALSSAFIPVFSDYCSTREESEVWRLANSIFNLLLIFTGFVVTAGIVLAPFYIPYLGIGFRGNPAQLSLTIYLTQLMWPFLIFISLAALVMAILNCKGHFASPAFAPLFFNLSLVFCGILLMPRLGIYSLALGVLLGGVIQLLFQVPSIVRRGFTYQPIIQFKEEGVRRVFRLIIPAILGSITLQISVIVTRIFASTLPPGSISGLQYAMRLIQFPLGLFPIALSTAIFPHLSSLVAVKDMGGVKKAVSTGLRMVSFLLIPSSVGLIMIREELIRVLFQHGAFSYQDTLITGQALLGYSVGLFAMGAVMILTRTFYSLQDVVTPLKIFIFSLLVNIVLNFLLIGPLKHQGLALATSLSVILNMGLLILWLKKKLGDIDGYSILSSIGKISLASALMGAGIYLFSTLFELMNLELSFAWRIGYVCISLAIGIGIIAGVSHLMKIQEFKFLIRSVLKKR